MATLSGQPDVAFTQSGEIPLAGEGGYNGVEVDVCINLRWGEWAGYPNFFFYNSLPRRGFI